MRLSRALIVTLALLVSPVAPAVCEVVCGLPPATAAAPVDDHAHHGHHAAPRVASSNTPSASLSAPDCDLTQTSPARLRTAFADSTFSVAATTTPKFLWANSTHHSQLPIVADASPPAPPPHTPVPLRI